MAQQEYTIQYGETLSGVGQRFGLNYNDIATWNNIQNPNEVQAGRTLKLYNPTANTPSSSGDVTSFLNNTQQQQFIKENTLVNPYIDTTPKTDQQIKDEITAATQTTAPLPVTPNLEQTYTDQRAKYGMDTLERDLADLTNQENKLLAERTLRANNEKNQRVGMGVIAGRVSQIDQQTQDQLDFIGREKSYKANQITAANSVISTIMSLKGQDFQNSLSLYNTELDKNMKTYQLFRDTKNDLRDFTQKQIDTQKDFARANLQIYMDMFKEGNLFYNNLDADTKLNLEKLSVQAGLGVGFMKNVKMDQSKRTTILGDRVDPYGNKYVDMMVIDDNGNKSIQSTYVGKEYVASMYSSSSSSSSSQTAEAKAAADANQKLQDYTSSAIKSLESGTKWGVVWNRFTAAYPQLTKEDIDSLLGVPKDRAGKDGWRWWQENGGVV